MTHLAAPVRAEPVGADGEPSASSATAAPAPGVLDEAKELFRSGVALLNQGSVQSALDAFQRSRALVASGKNTTNAAICLERLGRYDEALELYEDVLARFVNDLPEDDRRALVPAIEALRARVGNLEVQGSPGGLVAVDDLTRGRLPLGGAVRVLPGQHRLEVQKDGFLPFERNVFVEAGQTVIVDATLVPRERPKPPPANVARPATESPRSVAEPRWGLPVLLAGSATLVAGGVTWIVSALSLKDAREALALHCATLDGDECLEATASERDAAQAASDDALTSKRLRSVGIAATGLGAVTAAIGLYGLLGTGKAAHPAAGASLHAAPGSIEIEWRARF